jgi:histidinol-phosphate aminotransferase
MARTDALVLERARVSAGLREAGFELPPSQANFVWLPLGDRTTDFTEQAAEARLVVRPFTAEGVRVTIGAPEENDALLHFAREWIARTES